MWGVRGQDGVAQLQSLWNCSFLFMFIRLVFMEFQLKRSGTEWLPLLAAPGTPADSVSLILFIFIKMFVCLFVDDRKSCFCSEVVVCLCRETPRKVT